MWSGALPAIGAAQGHPEREGGRKERKEGTVRGRRRKGWRKGGSFKLVKARVEDQQH